MLVGVSVLDGMLCAYATYGHASNRAFEIWVLKDYGINESWNSLFIKHQLLLLKPYQNGLQRVKCYSGSNIFFIK